MASPRAERAVLPRSDRDAADRDDGSLDDVIGPIVAGAFARGLAEAFDLLGVPALFIGRDGRVLFVAKATQPCLGHGLRLHAGHLVAEAAADNAALAAFVTGLLRAPEPGASLPLEASGLVLDSLPVPGCAPPGEQMLRAIVLLRRLDGSPSPGRASGKNTVDAMTSGG